MKAGIVAAWLLLSIVCSIVIADDISDEIPEDFDLDSLDQDYDLARKIEEKALNNDLHRENTVAAQIYSDIAKEHAMKIPAHVDPCASIKCGAGRVCQVKENEAACVCVSECAQNDDPRRLVCTNHNTTWNSACEVYRQRCLCDMNDAACKGPEFKHMHIDYYGQCSEQPDCTPEEMSDFPRRMREWLYSVMRDLAQRDELPDHYKLMQQEAETNQTRGWANAAVWKWCDLDGKPHDRSVSRHELFPIRAPLMSLEHCIAPFLESCDPNDDHRITLKEWGGCLGVDESDMLDQCDEVAAKENSAAKFDED